MFSRFHRHALLALLVSLLSVANVQSENLSDYRSHPPTRPLAEPSNRPMGQGTAYFVDASAGDDENDGSLEKPWKTVARGVRDLQAGETLYLQAGTYYEHITVTAQGTAEKPITIRSYPGELAVINGGLREFMEHPQEAWVPVPGGDEGEYRSRRKFPGVGASASGCYFLGNFGDSMVPLQGYRFLEDLRDSSMAWDVTEKVGDTEGVYCGPGIAYSVETGHLHCRLAHTNLLALGEDNYRGETDPRKLPLVIAGIDTGPAITIQGSQHVRIFDLMICGARTSTLQVSDCYEVRLEGITVYGGSAPIGVAGTTGLRVHHTACRGIAAPWTFRGHLKYRSIESKLFSASGWSTNGRNNQDFEIAYCEFTDSVDGVFIGNVRNVHFHHNLLDNVSDDGMFLTSTTAFDGTTHGGEHYIYQNLLRRCLSTFAFGVGHGRQKMTSAGRQTGAGVWIYRNVFDFRRPVHYQLPAPNEPEVLSHGRVTGEHGSPTWEPLTVYHNTIVEKTPLSREYYLSDLAGHLAPGPERKLFNNIAVQANGLPGRKLPPVVLASAAGKASKKPEKVEDDPLASLLDDVGSAPKKKSTIEKNLKAEEINKLKEATAKKQNAPLPTFLQADGNLHWSYSEALKPKSFFNDFRTSEEFAASKKLYPAGWTSHDVISDPHFVRFDQNWREAIDLQLQPNSPAIDGGVDLPKAWPDPLLKVDSNRPDVGALPMGSKPWRVGIQGRLNVLGETSQDKFTPQFTPVEFPKRPAYVTRDLSRAVAIVEGYPAFDSELLQYLLKKNGIPADVSVRAWLNTEEYANYKMVVLLGDLARSKMSPNQYSESDFARLTSFLEQGGTLLLMLGGQRAFASPEARAFLGKLIGNAPPLEEIQLKVLKPESSWLKHLDFKETHGWIQARTASPIKRSKGEVIIGTEEGRYASLLRARVGKGELIYLGWQLSEFLPNGRASSTPEAERLFEEQMQLLDNLVNDVFPLSSSKTAGK